MTLYRLVMYMYMYMCVCHYATVVALSNSDNIYNSVLLINWSYAPTGRPHSIAFQ